jgi:hypothetical protein
MCAYFNSTSKDGTIYKWYYLLKGNNDPIRKIYKRGLLDDIHNIEEKTVICAQPQPQQRFFSAFNTHIDFYELNETMNESDRHFYEVIFGESPQKPHFDLDIPCDENGNYISEELKTNCDNILSELLQGIIYVCKKVNVKINPENDIRVYTSHGINKRSYHVILCNYCHSNNLEARAFYDNVMETLPEYIILSKCIDSSVYSVKQQFRILGSSKPGTNRIKTRMASYKINEIQYEGKVGNKLEELEHSLVSYTSGCIFLPEFCLKNKSTKITGDGLTLSNEIVQSCVQLMGISLNIGDIYSFFSVSNVKGGLISLKKKRPYNCVICNRVHENENPYLRINIYSQVYYYCRRNEKAKILLGCIEEELVAANTLDFTKVGPVPDLQFVGLTPLDNGTIINTNENKNTFGLTKVNDITNDTISIPPSNEMKKEINIWCTDVIKQLELMRVQTSVPLQKKVNTIPGELEDLINNIDEKNAGISEVNTDDIDDMWK